LIDELFSLFVWVFCSVCWFDLIFDAIDFCLLFVVIVVDDCWFFEVVFVFLPFWFWFWFWFWASFVICSFFADWEVVSDFWIACFFEGGNDCLDAFAAFLFFPICAFCAN
jgi:hypothetical protein